MRKKTLPTTKLAQAVTALEHALTFLPKGKRDSFYLAGIAKHFEICFEYAWKYLRQRVLDEGLEAYGPKETIKQAGTMGLIDSVETWLDFLEDRNLAVHDYLGIADADYLQTIQRFLPAVQQLLK